MVRPSVVVVVVLGVLVGLAGCNKQAGDRGKTLARVGSKVISEADVQDRLNEMSGMSRSQYEDADGRRRLLERLVEEEMYFQAAEDAGMGNHPDVLKEVDRVRRNGMLRTYYDTEIRQKAAPSPEEVEEYYRSHMEEFRSDPRVRVRHVLTRTRAEAERVRGLAEMGRDFDQLARDYSIDERTREDGGLIPGYLAAGRQVPLLGKVDTLVEAALRLQKDGEISPVVETSLGFHVVRAEEVNPGGLTPLDEVREQISQQLTEGRSRDLFTARSAELTNKYHVKYMDDYQPLTVEALFEQAQSARTPAERIQYYEKVLQNHPDDPRAYEAQFMIGFTNSEELHNYDRARAAFEAVVRNYPGCELYESAQWMLENLGRGEAPPAGMELPPGVEIDKERSQRSSAGDR